ncbi:hypothetical protein C8R45DRAFT_838460 [Mycena sanguinolenta]|nr:hypothetical protein C8R45DRAFT_838460 [Mycena sanguinolenta]
MVEADVRQTRSQGSQNARPAPTDVPEVDRDDSDKEGERAEDNAPKWAKNACVTLLGVGPDAAGLEARWTKGVQLWWDLERSTRFVSPVKGLGTTKRPDEIHTWIKCARTTKPKIKSMSKFVEEWQEWWRLLNPEWRTMCDEVTGMLRADEESLEMLRKPGANGLLSVMIGLKWWRDEEGETREWVTAFEDVTWVMGRLLSGYASHPTLASMRLTSRARNSNAESREGES